MSQLQIEYSKPALDGSDGIARAWARVPEVPTPAQRAEQKARAVALLKAHNAVLVAHYYVDGDLQDLALETGGCVADSLEMARFGRDHPARTLVVAGVRFMGETSKILSPEKRVLMPDLEAACSLDLGCPPDDFAAFCDAHPDRTVVVYANTSAAVKARADWMVTSSCALPIVEHLTERGKKILWAPDRHLGSYVERETGADMLLWNGACVVHEEFKGVELALLREEHPEALVLVHPESPESVVAQADVVGSTAQLLAAVIEGDALEYIVATDNGIFHRMRQLAPGKTLIEAPTAGSSATCKSCAQCPWMALNAMAGVIDCLERGRGEIDVPEPTRVRALGPIERMLAFWPQTRAASSRRGTVRAAPRLGLRNAAWTRTTHCSRTRRSRKRGSATCATRCARTSGPATRPRGWSPRVPWSRACGFARRPCCAAGTGSRHACGRSTLPPGWSGDTRRGQTWPPTAGSARCTAMRVPSSPPNARRSTSCSCCRAPPRSPGVMCERSKAPRRSREAARSSTRARRSRACAGRRSTPSVWAAGRTSAWPSGTAS